MARLAFAGEDLLILTERGKIYLIQGKSFDVGTPTSPPLELPTNTYNPSKIVDLAFVNGIYYVLVGRQVYAYVRTKNTAIQLFNQQLQSDSFTGIAVNKQCIVLLNSRNSSVLQLNRPITVTAGFGESTAASVIPFFEYLLTQNALPTRSYVSTRDYKSVDELLLDQRIIFRTSGESNAAADLFCHLNRDLCGPSSELFKKARITKGQKVMLPDLAYTEVIGYATKSLQRQTVSDYLNEAFEYSPTVKARFTENFLWSLNELSKSETPEIQLQSKVPGALLAMPPRRSVSPGTILKVGPQQDYIAGTLASCGIQMKSTSNTLNLAPRIKNTVKGDDAVNQLPRTSISSVLTKRLKQLDLTEVQFQLDNTTVEQGDQKAISSAMAANTANTESAVTTAVAASAEPQASLTPNQKTCLTAFFGPTSYLVVDAVKVKSGRYKIFKNQSIIKLTKDDLNRLGLLGEPDPTGEWSFVVNAPYHIAYRLSTWADESVLQSPTPKIVMSPGTLRPGGRQDILKLSNVSLLLPHVNQWQFTFLLKESELTSESSEFNRLKSANKFTALRAEETTRGSGTVLTLPLPPNIAEISLDALTQQRTLLKQQIHFPTDYQSLEVKVGVGERRCRVDKTHLDFTNESNQSAWMADTTDSSNTPCFTSSPAARKVKSMFEVSEEDHGTHVAGLIGARLNSPAPGLVPSAQLFLVDATESNALYYSIDRAVSRDVHIFNFSFEELSNDQDLHDGINGDWRSSLFVVAVDNYGTDLNTATTTPPLSWMEDLKSNMIGVGSSITAAGSQYVLGDWQTSKGLEVGSSYGKKYVHLIAPGHLIYSTIAGNAYGPQTGASQAAPQVTAAAALLFGGADIVEPSRIKARLIYTSDWYLQLRGKVWGGFLNVNSAVWEPRRNLVFIQTSSNIVIDAMKLNTNNNEEMTIKKKGAIKYERDLETRLQQDEKVPFSKILRLTRLSNKTFRVIYLNNTNTMQIVLNAEISGKFPCQSVEQLNGQVFAPSSCAKYGDYGLDVTQVDDYIASIPPVVIF
jgi:hypothetical protein